MRFGAYATLSLGLVGSALVFSACGDGEECRVMQLVDGGAEILCDDGTTSTIPRPADGAPPETCELFDVGTRRYVRCGAEEYPIGSSTVLCPTGYFPEDIYLPARTASQIDALERFELTECPRLGGALVFGINADAGERAPEGDLFVVSEIPESVLNLEEILGGIQMNFVEMPEVVTFPNLVRSGLPKDGLDEFYGGPGIAATYARGLRELYFPSLVFSGTFRAEIDDLEVLEAPKLIGDPHAFYEPVFMEIAASGLKRLVLSSVEGGSIDVITGARGPAMLRDVDLSSLRTGDVAFYLDRGATLRIREDGASVDLSGGVWVDSSEDVSSWEALWPNVTFTRRE